MIVDSEAGRLYLTGRVDGVEQILALAAPDGRLVMSYAFGGLFALDPVHSRLYVDQNESGLVALDTETGAMLAAISLPHDPESGQLQNPAPQADPTTGYALVFRDNLMYVVNPDAGTVVDTVVFEVPRTSCDVPAGLSAINWTAYDSDHRLLYLKFTTYTCTPSFGETLVSYDFAAGTEITRHDINLSSAIAANGFLYGSGTRRIPYVGPITGYRWGWKDGKSWLASEDWPDWGALFVDVARGRLYESHFDLRVLDTASLSLAMSVPKPVEGELAGFDPKTDQLYFLSEGKLGIFPASAIEPPSPEPVEVSALPSSPLRRLFVSPTWPQDRGLFGLWDYGQSTCHTLDGIGGLLFVSGDGGETWGQPRGGLRGICDRVSDLAISPGYARDQTMLAGILGMGVWKSTDSGRLWQPSNTGLSHLYVRQILLSPAFERDQTALVRAGRSRGTLYRSVDGGAVWQPLGVHLDWVAMSPEFDRDQTLMGVGFEEGDVLLSQDAGNSWERVGSPPDGVRFSMLSIAPLFSEWKVVFAYGGGALYHSTDGGQSWSAVLTPGPELSFSPPQLVYGPATGEGRTLFLLVTTIDTSVEPPLEQVFLYHSEDAVNWRELELPEDVSPTALAISPDFVQDDLLFFGTADGQVISLQAAQLVRE